VLRWSELFAILQVASAVEPDLVIFVMDSSIGQAAQEQAQAFRESVQARPRATSDGARHGPEEQAALEAVLPLHVGPSASAHCSPPIQHIAQLMGFISSSRADAAGCMSAVCTVNASESRHRMPSEPCSSIT